VTKNFKRVIDADTQTSSVLRNYTPKKQKLKRRLREEKKKLYRLQRVKRRLEMNKSANKNFDNINNND
jgi:hypothetical protein